MAQSFRSLPAEIVQAILDDLDLDDMRALRLTCTVVAYKVNDSSFREHFREKQIYVTDTDALQAFVEITRQSNLACLLNNLVLVGITDFKTKGSRRDMNDYAVKDLFPCQLHGTLLGEAFNNIRVNSQSSGLRTMSLEVVTRIGDRLVCTDESLRGSMTEPCKPRPARQVWHAIANVFEIAVIGLAKGQMPVEELHLFTKIERCALAADAFSVAVEHNVASALQAVKRLSMRISERFPRHPLWPYPQRSDSFIKMEHSSMLEGWKGKSSMHQPPGVAPSFAPMKEVETDEDGCKIRAWLESFPFLESLEVQWFDLAKRRGTPPRLSADAFFDEVGYNMGWPWLAKLTLRNVSMNANSIHSFLTRHTQMKEVELHSVYLKHRGDINGVKELIQGPNAPFERIEITKLWKSRSELLIGKYIKGGHQDRESPAIHFARPHPSREQRESDNQDVQRRFFGPPWRLD